MVPGAATYLLLLPLQDFNRDLMLISKKRESCRLSMVRAGRSGAPAALPPPPAAAGGTCRCRRDAGPGGRRAAPAGTDPSSPAGPRPGAAPPQGPPRRAAGAACVPASGLHPRSSRGMLPAHAGTATELPSPWQPNEETPCNYNQKWL